MKFLQALIVSPFNSIINLSSSIWGLYLTLLAEWQKMGYPCDLILGKILQLQDDTI